LRAPARSSRSRSGFGRRIRRFLLWTLLLALLLPAALLLVFRFVPLPLTPLAQLHPTQINGEPLRTYFHWLAPAYGLTLTGHRVVCLPCGLDHTGMPFGIQICGRRFGDWRVLSIAAALERHLQDIPALARPLPDFAALAARPAR
jgi:amidase